MGCLKEIGQEQSMVSLNYSSIVKGLPLIPVNIYYITELKMTAVRVITPSCMGKMC